MAGSESAARAAFQNSSHTESPDASQAAAAAAAFMFKKKEEPTNENSSALHLGLPRARGTMTRSQSNHTINSTKSSSTPAHRRTESMEASPADPKKKQTWNDVNKSSSSAALAAASLVARNKPTSMVAIPSEAPQQQRATMSRSNKPNFRHNHKKSLQQPPLILNSRRSSVPAVHVDTASSTGGSSPRYSPLASPSVPNPKFTSHSNSSAVSDLSLTSNGNETDLRPPKFAFSGPQSPSASIGSRNSDENTMKLPQFRYADSVENLWATSTPSPGFDLSVSPGAGDYFSQNHHAYEDRSYESLVVPTNNDSSDSLSMQKAEFPNRTRQRRRQTVHTIDDEEEADEDMSKDASEVTEDDSDAVQLPRYPLLVHRDSYNPSITHQPLKSKNKLKNMLGLKGTHYSSVSDLSEPSATPLVSPRGATQQPSKPVQFKTTLRKEDAKAKKKAFNEAKPWKYHTDSNTVTEVERKRYEGVWAANKALYMDMLELDSEAEKSQLILGVVVREIWRRSRLHDETLSHIWDLVDRKRNGTLDKQEFVVGMWFVDQCLYGKKLPKTVGDIVWHSVENSAGVNVNPKAKRGVKHNVKKVVGR